MSADDWIPCPFCSKKYRDEISGLNLLLENEYDVLTAKKYDELKAKTESRIRDIQHEYEEKAYARIDGTSNHSFNERGELSISMGALCPHCKRTWTISVTAKPVVNP